MLPEHGDCLDGGEAFVTLDGWAAGPDTVAVKQIGTAIAATSTASKSRSMANG